MSSEREKAVNASINTLISLARELKALGIPRSIVEAHSAEALAKLGSSLSEKSKKETLLHSRIILDEIYGEEDD